MPKKPTRRTSPSRTRLDKKVLRRKAKNLKRKGKSRTDATPPPARGVRESLKQPILDLYHKGKSVNEIASSLHTSPNRVYIHLHRAGLPSPTKKPQLARNI